MTDPALHASDLEGNAPVYHVPAGTQADQVPVWDGGKWVATAPLTALPDHDHVATGGLLTYRQFTYVPDGAGSFSFVVDGTGMPVFALLTVE
jgi:hypothetical protein